MQVLSEGRAYDDYERMFRVVGVSGDVLLRQGWDTDTDGIYWGLQLGVCCKARYTAADYARTARMASLTPIAHGDLVIIAGQCYRANILGNFSDCVKFEPMS